MNMRFKGMVSGLVALCAVAAGMPTAALPAEAGEAFTYAADEDIQVAGVRLRIMAGSVQDGLVVDGDSVTVSVPNGESFEIRTVEHPPRALDNDSGLEACNIMRNLQNQMFISGPQVVDILPSAQSCSTAGYGTDQTPTVEMTDPMEGQELLTGQPVMLFWRTGGLGVAAVRIRLSVDGGSSFTVPVVDDLMDGGFYQWTVPDMDSTDSAVLKIEGTDGSGNAKAVGLSPTFRIRGTEPSPTPPPAPLAWNFDVQAARDSSPTGSIGDMFSGDGTGSAELACASGLRIKSRTSPSVYLCGADGRRHAFPNSNIYNSWFLGDFAGVVEVSDDFLASLPLGANVTYRAGIRMVKVDTDPKTYVVAPGNVLRWVPSEDAAVALYGADWNREIDDLPDSFFADYSVGEPLELE
ncbi:hypothetical protein JW899_00415 [Candidatus Uhrbacteria bacterium]|nr:hypothetical protein [Candidatus Uhrbacteria bacterium]